eukprot:TRINITY_DN4264_c0_g1_i3.p2 TRINITY_DN4264_c0_g1~~TRINITY_DN4264_c0_g1_i3.p2  ORF type:complete len:139 (-),score=41.29 TRINITY_DN4264_c0_g1_i3:52-468(-)
MPVGNGFRELSLNTKYLHEGDDHLCAAHAAISENFHEIMEACRKFDTTHSGAISMFDLRRILYSEIRVLPSHMDQIFKTVTADSHGDVRYRDWIANFSRSMPTPVSYTHLRAHETPEHLVCRLLLEKKKTHNKLPASN